MNRKQVIALWIGVAIIVTMIIYPPWIVLLGGVHPVAAGYSWLWHPPEELPSRIDTARLHVELFAAITITAAAMLCLHKRRSS